MGIPYFFYNIYRKYNDASSLVLNEHQVSKLNVTHLFFDYNSMIHPCAQEALAQLANGEELVSMDTDEIEDVIIKACIQYTRYIMTLVSASNVYIVIDGVAPRAKINQQRERRFKSSIFRSSKSIWDSNKITPGTPFMDKLKTALVKAFPNETISDSNEPGEGEHKMMKYIRELDVEDSSNQSICIYGLDADLIMLSLLNTKSDQIFLLRDTKDEDNNASYNFLNIRKLKYCIAEEFSSKIKYKMSESQIIKDYVFLCFFLGNDFLEHIPSLTIKANGVNALTKVYTYTVNKFKRALINNENKVDFNVLCEILLSLSNTEEYYFANVFREPIWRDEETLAKIKETSSLSNSVSFYQNDLIQYNKPGYKTRYYKYYGINDVMASCRDYFAGLIWIWGYYNGHKHDNWSWYYGHHTSPFASDLYACLKYNLKHNKNLDIEFNATEAITPRQQLFMVLPRQSLENIIGKVPLLNCDSNMIQKMFPKNLSVDLLHKEYLWQSKLFLNNFDENLINLFV
jgi:5'-3' exonuclease